MGQKRTTPKVSFLTHKRVPLRTVSPKQRIELTKLSKLTITLRKLCRNKSELDGSRADWRTAYQVEPHHIDGREGKKLLSVFNIVMVTRGQHDLMDGNTYEEKQALLEYIKPIRLKQGFKVEDYE